VQIVELLKSFQETPLTVEQAERLAAIRQAATGFAAVVHQGLPDSHWRDECIRMIRQTLAIAREAVGVEVGAGDVMQERQAILEASRDGLSRRQHAALAALLGVAPPAVEDDGPESKGGGKRQQRQKQPATAGA